MKQGHKLLYEAAYIGTFYTRYRCIRDVIVVFVDQAFALVDFVASGYFNLNALFV